MASQVQHTLDTRSEHHVFVLWHNALHHRTAFLTYLSNRFSLVFVYPIEWSRTSALQNLQRLYLNDFGAADRLRRIGNGHFLVAIVRDRYPKNRLDVTPSGQLEVVNTNIVEAKRHLRNLTESPEFKFNVHSSNSVKEARRDGLLLLGAERYLEAIRHEGAPVFNSLVKTNLAGTNGWKNWAELRLVMNTCTDYTLLRPIRAQTLTDNLSGEGGDVDVLVPSLQSFSSTVNGVPTRPDGHGNHFRVLVGGVDTIFDLRSVGDGDADPLWQRDMLSKSNSDCGLHVASDVDLFFYLIYHYYAHKGGLIAPHAYQALRVLAKRVLSSDFNSYLFEVNALRDPEMAAILIRMFFGQRGYKPTSSKNIGMVADIRFWESVHGKETISSQYLSWLREHKTFADN